MGKIKWSAYGPEDVNHEARSLVEAWSRPPEAVHIQDVRRVRVRAASGWLFTLGMLALAAATWVVLL